VNGATFIVCVKTDFLKDPGANGQNTVQGAVSNPTPRRFRTGVCPAVRASSWRHPNVSWHKVLLQCLKLFIENNGIRANSVCGTFTLQPGRSFTFHESIFMI
jgi:hypothetical protein